MFTGIIEELGKIEKLLRRGEGAIIAVRAPLVAPQLSIGESIAVNGACLTVVAIERPCLPCLPTGTATGRPTFQADVMSETLNKTNLGKLKAGDMVNLERALRLGERLSGHLVSGHIDGLGRVVSKQRKANAIGLKIEVPSSLARYIVSKGSIAVDGVSLTVADVADSFFTVSIIPHTAELTTLGEKSAGSEVNIEVDILGKYVEKMFSERISSNLTLNKLRDYDFLKGVESDAF
ncbi:MAG: riboflavin synthase [Candidatus Subteraquimicrobiales bacterium]|nr:riboflavin synthase [Candidatus Subteraquimicrobiales bacterium]